jgi:hypothetical protein
MASPLELIKQGLQNGDWTTVAEGYSKLTGEYISPPEEKEIISVGDRKYTKDELKHLPMNAKGRPNLFLEETDLLEGGWRETAIDPKDGKEKDIDLILNPKRKRARHKKRPAARYVTKKCDKCNREYKVVVANEKGVADANTDIYCSRCSQR